MGRLGEYSAGAVGIPEFRVVLPSARHRDLNAPPNLIQTRNLALSAATPQNIMLSLAPARLPNPAVFPKHPEFILDIFTTSVYTYCAPDAKSGGHQSHTSTWRTYNFILCTGVTEQGVYA